MPISPYKIVAGLQVFEEEDFIRESLESSCAICDHVIVVEGCWQTTTRVTGATTSTDKTMDYLNDALKTHKNLEVVHKHGLREEVEHREWTWQYVREQYPDLDIYYMGDGDEIYREDNIAGVREDLNNLKPMDAISYNHRLYWNDLLHYTIWNTEGARFFCMSGLDLSKMRVTWHNSIKNWGQPFTVYRPPNTYVHHASYCKSKQRQKVKWGQRSIEDGRPFPHKMDEDGYITPNAPIQIGTIEDLPLSLQRHPKCQLTSV